MNDPSEPRFGPAVRERAPLIVRVFIASGGAVVIWLGASLLSDVMWGPAMSLPKHIAAAVATFTVAVPLVVVACGVLDRRSVWSLGFTRGLSAWRDLLYGAATWLLPAGAGLTVAWGFGWLQIEIDATAAELVGMVLLLVALVFVNEAFPEELIFRGYVYRNLLAVMAPWIAIAVQAAIFAAFGTTIWVISQGWEVFGERLLIFFGGGIAAGCLRQVSRSVWATVGFHVAFQTVMQLFLFSHYIDIDVSDERVFTLATAVVAFVTVTMIASLFWRGAPNWTAPEPDPIRAADGDSNRPR